MKNFFALSLLASMFLVSCSVKHAPLTVASQFSMSKYQGEWHEIARLPNRFEKGVIAAKATYAVVGAEVLSVKNEGIKESGKTTEIEGRAKAVGPAKLKVKFNPFPANLFAGDYWVLKVNKAHTKALVGSPNRKYLWCLAKNAQLKAHDFSNWLTEIKDEGFEVEHLIENPQRIAK